MAVGYSKQLAVLHLMTRLFYHDLRHWYKTSAEAKKVPWTTAAHTVYADITYSNHIVEFNPWPVRDYLQTIKVEPRSKCVADLDPNCLIL